VNRNGATSRMTIREFEQRTGRDRRRRAQAARYARLIGVDGRVRPEYLRARACPTCGGERRRRAFAKNGVDYVVCEGCGLLHVARFVDAPARALLRADAAEGHVPLYLNDVQRSFDEPKFRHGAELLKRLGGGAPRVLDVGTAAGLFLEVLGELGLEHLGVDLREQDYGAWHAERGLAVHYGPFEEMGFEAGEFGAICFWDCLEHLFDPGAVLDTCAELLDPGGLVLLLVPNAGSLAARVLQERCAMFDGVEHINMFTPATLDDLCGRHGFERVHLETIIPEINVLNNYLDYDEPYGGGSTELARVLGLDALDEEFVLANHLGYKILAIYARR